MARSFLRRGAPRREGVELHRVVGGGARPVGGTGAARGSLVVTLVPMRSLSVDAFAFPFAGTSRVREALRLQAMGYVAGGGIEIFPVLTERAGKGSRGVAWYVSPHELVLPEGTPRGLAWPAPLALVSRVDGAGAVLWLDEEAACTMIWRDGLPVAVRWRPRGRATPEGEMAWADAWCAEQGIERGGSFVFDATDEARRPELEGLVIEALALCPWLRSVDLSRRALEGAEGLERGVRMATSVALWAFVAGALVLGGSLARLDQTQRRIEAARARTEALYKEAFDPTHEGRVRDPVGLARERLAALRGGGEGRALDEALSALGETFADASLDVTLDVLRYNPEGLDCTGLAPDMGTVLTFRKAWEGRAASAQLSDTQNVPGAGYRFGLRVRW